MRERAYERQSGLGGVKMMRGKGPNSMKEEGGQNAVRIQSEYIEESRENDAEMVTFFRNCVTEGM
jgi:hypothetical protein